MKILVIELSNLGDAILTYPVLQGLWEAYPEAEFHLVAGPYTWALFHGDERVDRVWIWDKKAPVWRQTALIVKLLFQWFDLVVDFRRTLIPFFLVGAKGMPLFRHSAARSSHKAEQHLALLDSIRVPRPTQPARLQYGPEDEEVVRQWLRPKAVHPELVEGPVVVMAPGAKSHLKRWAPERFAAVADRLIAEENAQVLLVGGGEDRPVAELVLRAMKQPATDLTGRTTLRQLAALLAQTQLAITNDSACLHAAEAMGVPTVAIFGPTDEKKYGPRNPRSAVARLSLVCAPCELALCPYNHECMTMLQPHDVLSAALKILASGPGRHSERSEESRSESLEGKSG